MGKLTNFSGWANDLEYLADEAEREKKAEATIALYNASEARQLSLRWRLTIIFGLFLLGTLAVCWGFAAVMDAIGW